MFLFPEPDLIIVIRCCFRVSSEDVFIGRLCYIELSSCQGLYKLNSRVIIYKTHVSHNNSCTAWSQKVLEDAFRILCLSVDNVVTVVHHSYSMHM